MFLLFSPLYGLILLANLAPAGRVWRFFTTLLVAAVNSVLVLGGALFTIGGYLQEPTLIASMAPGADIVTFGICLTITGILGFVLMLQRVQVALYPALRWALDPENTMHMVAVQIAIWTLGASIGSILLTRTTAADALIANAEVASLGAIWEQTAIFVFIALLGVGMGLRRGWRETFERLGLGSLSLMQIVTLPAIIIGLVIMQAGIGILWQWLDPASAARIEALSSPMFNEETLTWAGALSIGFGAGIGEELLMRGALQPRFGILSTTLIFAVLHSQYEFSFATLIVVTLSLILGLVRRYFNTTACILIHAGYNALLVLAAIAAESMM